MPEYHNPWPHTVELIGPNGERTRLKSGAKQSLDDYYDRYVSRGYIVKSGQKSAQIAPIIQRNITPNVRRSTPVHTPSQQSIQIPIVRGVRESMELVPTKRGTRKMVVQSANQQHISRRQIVGRIAAGNANKIYEDSSASAPYRISNGIGIGILSYNRGESLGRLVDSIIQTVDLNQVVLFISDDGSTDPRTIEILNLLQRNSRIVVLRNNNAGIAVNSNRLLRCLSRFEHIFLCNDDVEFISPKWIEFYVDGAKRSGLQHLCYRQPDIYGAKLGVEDHIRGTAVYRVNEKPHGAMLYMTNACLRTIGFFDTRYKIYGMEHVDWSMRPAEFGLQQTGFYDLVGATKFVRIHAETTSVSNKSKHYKNNKELFSTRISKQYIPIDSESVVPKISYVIPCRDIDRSDSIKTVVMGVIGQSFPEIEIWLVEQDIVKKIKRGTMPTINHLFVDGKNNEAFNKSLAFNTAVHLVTSDAAILHDADMLSRVDYTMRAYQLLQQHDALHICGRVLYISQESSVNINVNQNISIDTVFERIVNYFEGGSLAIKIDAYWKFGGFNEDYWGYGCEDCDFYTRISSVPSWLCNDEFDLVHLWHGRTDGWNSYHDRNKQLLAQLATLPTARRVQMQHEQLHALGYGTHLS